MGKTSLWCHFWFSKVVYGLHMAETNSTTPKIRGSLLPLASNPKMSLLAWRKQEKCRKTWRRTPSFLIGAKTTSSSPKIVDPSFPFSPATPKINSEYGEGQETTTKPWRRELSLFLLREGDKNPWGWVRNESHGCIMAWACLPKLLLAPQVKNTLSKNGWPPKFEFDLHTFPSQGNNFLYQL